jgi:hypothetical protein
MSNWRPIETAPKDGTEVIAASVHTVRERPRVWHVYLTAWDAAGWVTSRGGAAEPTHWIPCPEPPGTIGAQSEPQASEESTS